MVVSRKADPLKMGSVLMAPYRFVNGNGFGWCPIGVAGNGIGFDGPLVAVVAIVSSGIHITKVKGLIGSKNKHGCLAACRICCRLLLYISQGNNMTPGIGREL